MMLALVLAVGVGIALGVLGGGGSILAVPIFVYALGFDPKPAVAMSLAVVGVTSAVGAVGHWRAGNVDLRMAALFGTVAMAGTFAGARLAAYVSGPVQLVLFALVMLAAAYFMWQGRMPQPDEPSSHSTADLPLWHIAVEGAGVGLITGLVGVGGGFLVVPALVLLGRVPMRQAVGTSLVVIALKSLAGFVGYVDQLVLPWDMLALFTGAASLAILAGTWLSRYVPQQLLRHAFAVVLVGMSAFILWQNRDLLTSTIAEAAGSTAHVASALVETRQGTVS